MVVPDGEPGLGGVERGGVRVFDVVQMLGFLTEDEFAQGRDQRVVPAGKLGQFRAGGVDDADGAVGETEALITRGHGLAPRRARTPGRK
jgi:hypothetical protein